MAHRWNYADIAALWFSADSDQYYKETLWICDLSGGLGGGGGQDSLYLPLDPHMNSEYRYQTKIYIKCLQVYYFLGHLN